MSECICQTIQYQITPRSLSGVTLSDPDKAFPLPPTQRHAVQAAAAASRRSSGGMGAGTNVLTFSCTVLSRASSLRRKIAKSFGLAPLFGDSLGQSGAELEVPAEVVPFVQRGWNGLGAGALDRLVELHCRAGHHSRLV